MMMMMRAVKKCKERTNINDNELLGRSGFVNNKFLPISYMYVLLILSILMTILLILLVRISDIASIDANVDNFDDNIGHILMTMTRN